MFDSPRRVSGSVQMVAGAAGAAAVVLAALVFLPAHPSPPASLSTLASAWAVRGRPIEARLSGGFPWAPFRAQVRLASQEARSATRRGGVAESEHESGIALLLTGRPRAALAVLTAATAESNDAAMWNDLCVAMHETAVKYDAEELIADALAAADHALASRPDFPEALFNRALMIERLGFRYDARVAWNRYLAVDASSAWAAEARTHVAALAPEESFMTLLDRQYDRVAIDPAAAALLVDRDPFAARGLTIKEVLGRWGKAVVRGDERDAERHLRVARQFIARVSRNGDHMLEKAVAAIDRSSGATRMSLARAHAMYRDGLETYASVEPVQAEPLLRRAAAAFTEAGSPMSLPALFFAANTTYDQGRRAEAEAQLESLRANASNEFPAYRAFILWQLGMCHASRADWGRAVALYDESRALFGGLHETGNEAVLRQLLAIVYERSGDPESAWRERRAARNNLGERAQMVHEKTLASIADAAILRGEWKTAASFLTLEIDILRRQRDDAGLASTLFLRAIVRDRLRDLSGSRGDFATAQAAAARSQDASYRTALRIAERRALAMFHDTPPAEAARLLTEAIAFQETHGDPRNVPELLLWRARARRDAGDSAGALADVERGTAQLERARESLPEGDARWGAFHGAEDLFDLGVDLATAQDDAARAFHFAERGRARALLDSSRESPLVDLRRLPRDAVVVEYVSLPSRLVILTAETSRVHATIVDVPYAEMTADAETFVRAIAKDDRDAPVARDAAVRLYQHLIAPVEPLLAHAAIVAFVPDAALSAVPFSALRDGRDAFLIDRFAVVSSPSAATFIAAWERKRGAPPRPEEVLVVTGAKTAGDAGTLARVDDEARDIAALYPSATRLGSVDSPLDALQAHSREGGVVHFGGHAVGDDRGYEPASIVLQHSGVQVRAGVADIARLRLPRAMTVVLAGCSTARGVRRASEGVVSVAHGFLSAGASSVIATLWPIEDKAAATFFPRLHRRLAQGLTPAEALRAAQLESIRRGDVPPSLWAAVQDIGS